MSSDEENQYANEVEMPVDSEQNHECEAEMPVDSEQNHADEDEMILDSEQNHADEALDAGALRLQELLGNLSQGSLSERRRPVSGGLPDLLAMLNSRLYRDGTVNSGGVAFGGAAEINTLAQLINGLDHADEDPFLATEQLKQISENLLMMNQLFVDRAPLAKLFEHLAHIFNDPMLQAQLDLQMQACRCLYNLFEVNPESMAQAAESRLISNLQDKLVEISYIDLAEQVLETVELLSRLQGREILHTGSLEKYLQFYDFLTIHAQRKAIAIVSNACAHVENSDVSTILRFFPTFLPVFQNATDKMIITRALNIIYAICEGLVESEVLESLISPELVQRVISIEKDPDTSLGNRIKCFEILSGMAITSVKMTKLLMNSFDMADLIVSTFNSYQRKPQDSLQETLMFVPKKLLLTITRFIVILLPSKDGSVLVEKKPKTISMYEGTSKLALFCQRTAPILIDIYLTTVQAEVRELDLVALNRITSCMDESTANLVLESLVQLVGSIIGSAKTKKLEKHQSKERIYQLFEILQLFHTLLVRFDSKTSFYAQSEGIFENLNALKDTFYPNSNSNYELVREKSESSETSITPEDHEYDTSNVSDESDSKYTYHFEDTDIPDHVNPPQMKFDIFDKISISEARVKVASDVDILVETNTSISNLSSNELKEDISNFMKDLQEFKSAYKLSITDNDRWRVIWLNLSKIISNDSYSVSGYTFVSSGLASMVYELISLAPNSDCIPRNTFRDIFKDLMPQFVSILQTALTRVENFDVVESGLASNESGIDSITKQLHLELIPDTKQEDNQSTLSEKTIVAIHGFATVNVLADFLKSRIEKSRFIKKMMSGSSQDRNSDDEPTDDNYTFKFHVLGQEIASNKSIYHEIFRKWTGHNRSPRSIWSQPIPVTYTKVEKLVTASIDPDEEKLHILYPDSMPTKFTGETNIIVELLRFTRKGSLLDCKPFINPKISAKLSKQMDDLLIVATGLLPQWTFQMTKMYPFLIPYETRMLFLQSVSFGYARLIKLWKHNHESEGSSNSEDPLQQLSRLKRFKLRIDRDNLFAAGVKILEKYGSSPHTLEIEYQNEEGTGLGPTLEFYSKMSKSFSSNELDLWRNDTTKDSGYVENLLFPKPARMIYNTRIQQDTLDKKMQLFNTLGTLLARSILENRILDFRFNATFFEMMHNIVRCNKATSDNNYSQNLKEVYGLEESFRLLTQIDVQVARSLRYIWDNREQDVLLSDLSLTYISDRTPPDGEPLNKANAIHYVWQQLDAALGSGIMPLLVSFIEGFNRVFPYTNVLVLEPKELVELFGRAEEDWSTETLFGAITADHGYTMDSNTVHDLIEVMSNFTLEQRREFLQFLTGAPKLPIGGFKELKPQFTVVLKHAEENMTADQYLPSVMTCANYLKVPKYSSSEILRSRLIQAMQEGSDAFLLS